MIHPGTLDANIGGVRDGGVEAREALAQWMLKNSYATGHGDTIEDLLSELDWQHTYRIGKLEAKLRELLDLPLIKGAAKPLAEPWNFGEWLLR